MAITAANTRQTEYFTSLGWRCFFSVGFFYWDEVNTEVAKEHLP